MKIPLRHAHRPGGTRARGLRAVAASLLALALVPLTAIASAASTASAATATAAETPAGAAVPALAWHPCHDGFQCATARVPLDYRHPRGATIAIAVIRHLATDPAHRIGTLFFNGG